MRWAVIVLSAMVGLSAVSPPRRAAAQDFSDQAVADAIAKGCQYLWTLQRPDGSWPQIHQYPVGPTALACYALLESGINPQDPRMAKALAWLTRQKTDKTYSLALRCNVWEAANRSTQNKYLGYLERDARQLWSSAPSGGYNYDCVQKIQTRWDNSNSQFGLLGVWAAVRNDVEVPVQYWGKVWTHWAQHQLPDGMWAYDENAATQRPTMTVGGIASLFICFDHVFASHFLNCRGGQYQAPIRKGLEWLDRHFPGTMRGQPDYYYYYGVERVALASGYKYFGKADWYKLGATNLVRSQRGNGSWPEQWSSELVSTSFALLYLIRGRHAVIFNKLEYDGYWNNRPRDLANLTEWMSRTFERTINWQIINLKVPVSEWHDAPILYIAGSKAPTFTDQDLAKLREFVLQGGAILSVRECGEEDFGQAMRQVYAKLFPAYKLVECPPTHPIYTREAHFDLPAGKPALHILGNGVRPLVVHCDDDLALDWHLRRSTTRSYAFRAAANIAKYVTGSVATLRPRGTTHWPEEPKVKATRVAELVRIRHDANWDPEPLAYVRFGRLLARDAHVALKMLPPTTIRDLPKSSAAIATLTGTGEFHLYEPDVSALRKYVEAGGTLLVDAAGGDKAFADSAQKVLGEAFPGRLLRRLASHVPLYNLPGMVIDRVRYRLRTDFRLGKPQAPYIQGIVIDGRAAVLFSREDLTAGLVGYPSHTVDGYEPPSAHDLMRNIVVYAGKRARAPENPANAARGLRFTYFDSRFSVVHSGTAKACDLGKDKRDGQFALKLEGFLDAPREGTYRLYTVSPEAHKLYVGDRLVVSSDGGWTHETRSDEIQLQAGKHAITLTAFQGKGDGTVRLLWEGPGINKQDVPTDALYHAVAEK